MLRDQDVNPIRLYVKNRDSITVDISQLIKLSIPKEPHNTDYNTLGDIPIFSNIATVTLLFSEVSTGVTANSSIPITKTFISGGVRTYEKNQTYGSIAKNNNYKIPTWGGRLPNRLLANKTR